MGCDQCNLHTLALRVCPFVSIYRVSTGEYRNRPLRNKAFGVVGTDAVWVGIA
jgi:hypothetical protein